MITGLDLQASTPYTVKSDKDNPTVWQLGIMPSYLFARLSNQSANNEIETAFQLLQLSIKGWDNFGDIKFTTEKQSFFGQEYDVVPIKLLDTIPISVITELSLKVMEINQLSIGERKN